MIAVKISNKKDFMGRLLATDLFDSYYVEEAVIETFNTFHVDGHIHKDFYKNDETTTEADKTGDFSRWSDLRSLCFDLIKGKRTPLGFKLVFHPDEEVKKAIVAEADAGIRPEDVLLGINIRFNGEFIQITTGTTFKIFSMDKTIEKAWDEYIPSFLSKSNISTIDYD
ncbi:MAG: hypothetical protein IJI01_09680 [Butyrivibrio sp.]|uniref:DUF5721 family protein n=1 Tax=Butyrivibrio sp. TaxID=28121 RepID=UPI0025C08442|nr:DUF5721 family protein [Butyrivibrio sp.]MBQ6588937.1 hypothetical protein [Butyrivibrio sp.]